MEQNIEDALKTRCLKQALAYSRYVTIIGVKGVPPEFPGTSGVEFYVAQRIPMLVRDGKHVACYVRNWATPRQMRKYKGAYLIHVPSVRGKYFDTVTHTFLSTIHACFSTADTLWYQTTGPGMFSFIPRLFGKRVVVTIHTLEWKRKKWGRFAKIILRLAEIIAVRNAHIVVAVSDGLADYLKNRYGVDAYIDPPSVIKTTNRYSSSFLKKYGLSGKDYVLYVGRFVPEKRIEWLIRGFQKLRPKGVKLVLAGGESNSRAYWEALRALAIRDTSIIFTGWVFGKEKEELMQNCKLFVLPSSIEGNPMVIHELLDSILLLASDTVVKEVRRAKKTYSFPVDDERAFDRQLKKII